MPARVWWTDVLVSKALTFELRLNKSDRWQVERQHQIGWSIRMVVSVTRLLCVQCSCVVIRQSMAGWCIRKMREIETKTNLLQLALCFCLINRHCSPKTRVVRYCLAVESSTFSPYLYVCQPSIQRALLATVEPSSQIKWAKNSTQRQLRAFQQEKRKMESGSP